jgi:hypothetical protein
MCQRCWALARVRAAEAAYWLAQIWREVLARRKYDFFHLIVRTPLCRWQLSLSDVEAESVIPV